MVVNRGLSKYFISKRFSSIFRILRQHRIKVICVGPLSIRRLLSFKWVYAHWTHKIWRTGWEAAICLRMVVGSSTMVCSFLGQPPTPSLDRISITVFRIYGTYLQEMQVARPTLAPFTRGARLKKCSTSAVGWVLFNLRTSSVSEMSSLMLWMLADGASSLVPE